MPREADASIFAQPELDLPVQNEFDDQQKIKEQAVESLELHGKEIEFTIPGEPISGSQLKFNRKTGNAYRPKEHQQRVFEVHEFAERAVQDYESPVFRLGTALQIEVVFYFPYRKQDYGTGKNAGVLKPNRPKYMIGGKDVDNLLKPLKDGMKGLIYQDDNQIVNYVSVSKQYAEYPRTLVKIQEVIS